jgi:hypothetical protein
MTESEWTKANLLEDIRAMTDEELRAFMKKNGIEGAEPMPSEPLPPTFIGPLRDISEFGGIPGPEGYFDAARAALKKPRRFITLPNGNAVRPDTVMRVRAHDIPWKTHPAYVEVQVEGGAGNELVGAASLDHARALRDRIIADVEEALA